MDYTGLQEHISEGLGLYSDILLTADAAEDSANLFWKEKDALNATHILSCVLGNIVIHKMMDANVSLKGCEVIVTEIAEHLKKAFHLATGKDPKDVLEKLYPKT